MYQTNQAFLEAMDDISRTLAVQVEIGGDVYPTESIIDFELERGAFDGDVFTIGQTLSSALTLTIFATSSVKIGDEVKLFTDLLVGDSYVRVPMGIYYVDSTSVNQEKMTLTCYDKMVSLVEEYIPSGDHKTLAALFNDVRTQIGMKYDGAFTDVAIKQPLYGYTYRETLGFIASLNGGNMTINRSGNLEIQGYQEVERHIPAKTCFSFDVKEGYHVSKVFCLFGDVGISRGDNTGQCVSFENPYVTEQNIDVIYNRLKGLRFTAGSLKYRGDLTLDPGDLFTFTDYKGDEYILMCGRNKLTFNGGLSGQLESIGESENSNVYAEHQLKYKKNMTKVTAELGKIQAIVQEIEQSHDGLEERVKKAELEMTADAITSKIKDSFVSKDEREDLVTQEELTSAISQTTTDITLQVSNTYTTKTEFESMMIGGDNLIANSNFEGGLNVHWESSPCFALDSGDKSLKYLLNSSSVAADKYKHSEAIDVRSIRNKELVLSFDVWLTKATPRPVALIQFFIDKTSTNMADAISFAYVSVELEKSQLGTWVRVTHNVIVPGDAHFIRISALSTLEEDVWWRKFQLQQGNTATDWSPSTKDNVTNIANAKNEVITQMNSAISVAKNEINSSVSNTYTTKTEFNNAQNSITSLQTRMNTAEQKITDQAIINTVSSTYTTKAEFNALSIGGGNLLTGTKDWKNGGGNYTNLTETYKGFVVLYKDNSSGSNYADMCAWNGKLEIVANEEYTLSFYAKGTGSFTSYLYPNCIASGHSSEGKTTNSSDGSIRHTLTSDWKRYWITWKVMSTIDERMRNVLPMRLDAGAKGYICGVKLERGNKATDWSPASEDLTAYADSVGGDISASVADLSQIVSANTGSDAMTPATKVQLVAEFDDITAIYNKINSIYNVIGDTSMSSLKTDMTTAYNNVKSMITTINNTIAQASETGLSDIVGKFSAFYEASEELQAALTNTVTNKTTENTTKITQLADSYNIAISKVESIEGDVDTLTTNFQFASDGLTIKSSANSTKYIKLDNDSLDFIDSGNMVAQISDNDLKISNATVNNQMKIGNISIKPSGKGGLMFVYE